MNAYETMEYAAELNFEKWQEAQREVDRLQAENDQLRLRCERLARELQSCKTYSANSSYMLGLVDEIDELRGEEPDL